MSDIDRVDYEVARGDVRSPGFPSMAHRPTQRPSLGRASFLERASKLMMENPREPFHFGPLGRHLRVDSCDATSQKVPRGVVSRRCARAARPHPRLAGPRFEELAVRLLGRRRRRPPRRHVRRKRGNRQVVPRHARRWLARSRQVTLTGAPWPPLRRNAREERHREHHWATLPLRRTSRRRPPPTARSTLPTSRPARVGARAGS